MKKTAFMLASLALVLASCGQNGATSSTAGDIQLIIGGPVSGQGNPALSGQAIDPEGVNSIESDSGSMLSAPKQFIVTANKPGQLKALLASTGGKLISDGSIPAAPTSVSAEQRRAVTAPAHQLIEIDSPAVSEEDFKAALARRSVKGTVRVSNRRAMNDYVMLDKLRVNAELSAEPNTILTPTAASISSLEQPSGPNTFFNASIHWGLNNPAVNNGVGNNVSTAWQNGYTGSGTIIAIIDTGFLKDDYELTGYNPRTGGYPNGYRLVYGYNFTAGASDPYNSLSASSNGDAIGSNGGWHGFSVAETAVGANNNQYGTSGVAPDARAYLFRIGQSTTLFAGSYSYYDASRAVDTATAWGANVINMSFGGRSPGAVGVPGTYLAEALARAEAAGVINVASAGNDGGWVNSTKFPWDTFPIPASWNSVISVGATDTTNNKTSYSAWGPGVAVFAPGNSSLALSPNVCGTFFSDRCINVPSAYTFNGTSNASPFVAGIAALMKQAKPNITTSQVRSILVNTSTRNAAGEAVVNAWAAVQSARTLP